MQRVMARGLVSIMVLLAPISVWGSTWTIDPDHSNIQFSVSHLGLAQVKGTFRTFQGTVTLDEKDISKSSVNITMQAASIDSGVTKRDEHLRSPEFFDVATYPALTFISKKVTPGDKGTLTVTGDLTIRGVTKETVLQVTGPTQELKDPWGNIRRGAAATTTINRQDFGLTYNKTLENGVLTIGNTVTINLEVEMIKSKEK